jgi:parvulin-like peptidyl-prolyl isomerase
MARLSGVKIDREKVIIHLKQEIKLRSIYRQILCRQIIDRAARERGILVSGEEIQSEADKFRYEHKLESASQTLEWLNNELLTADDWETGIRERLLTQKLSEELFGCQVENYFVQNKTRYDQAVLYRLRVPYHALAQEVFYQVEEEELSFFEAAHLYDIEEQRRLACGFEGKVSRWQMRPEMAAQVFGAHPGEVLGPILVDQGFELLMVEDFIPAELTPQIRQEILNQLFSQWLDSELNHLIHSDRPPTHT